MIRRSTVLNYALYGDHGKKSLFEAFLSAISIFAAFCPVLTLILALSDDQMFRGKAMVTLFGVAVTHREYDFLIAFAAVVSVASLAMVLLCVLVGSLFGRKASIGVVALLGVVLLLELAIVLPMLEHA